MGGQSGGPHGIAQYLIPIAVFVVIFGLRARRMSQMRPLKLGQLWIFPAIYLVIVAANFIARPPTLAAWIASGVALLVGAALGWQRGKLMQIHVDPETHLLSQKGSPLAILFLMAIVLIKLAAQGEGRALASTWNWSPTPLWRWRLGCSRRREREMYLRARRLLKVARLS